VLWKPALLSAEPVQLNRQGGMMRRRGDGDPNAYIPRPQPVHYRAMFGAFQQGNVAVTFVSKLPLKNRNWKSWSGRLGGEEHATPGKSTWCTTALPKMKRSMPETYEVRAERRIARLAKPAQVLADAQR